MNISQRYQKLCSSLFAVALVLVPSNASSTAAVSTSPFSVGENGQGNWAIALSGGGLRSSLFMVGALKALDEKGLVAPARAISTVSGGGYTGYWLYNLHHRNDAGKAPFGYTALSSEQFPTRICEFMTRGNFVTNAQIVRNFVAGNSVGLYQKSILRTYGHGDTSSQPLLLSNFRTEVAAGVIPEPIVNATINKPSPASGNHAIIEFSPSGIANARLGTTDWRDLKEAKLPYYRLAAISGAAVSQLKQKIDNPFSALKVKKLKLWDGGRSENLGAYALIRRGIPNVIIIDAEHDPKYGFGAYQVLKSRLAADGITLVSSELEATIGSRPPTSIFEAVAAGNGTSTKIYYIKMSLSKSLDKLLEQQSRPNSSGHRTQQDFQSALKISGAGSKKWNCQNLRSQPLNMAAWSAYNAGRYAAYLHDRDGTAAVFNATGIGVLALNFPHYTTVDQSFYVDQARAFIGLGYLQTNELSEAI